MSSASPPNSRSIVQPSRPQDLTNQFVCPYCGAVNDSSEGHCPHCTMENTPAARKATKARIGPWYVLQKRNPAAPGMKFETLLSFVHKGRVKAHSIVRGPTTHQLWRYAAHIKGLSREFGLCYSCGSALATSASICPQCNRAQSFVTQPDVFLESSADAENGPLVYREVPAPHSDPSDSAANRAEPTTQDAAPAAAAPEASRTSAATERSASERDVALPAMESERDMVIPSLPEEAAPEAPRPTSARERLVQARRMQSFGSNALDSDDADDNTFDGGPVHSPGQVGPTFAPGPRPVPLPVKRRLWIEGSIFVIILLTALGSGLMYVDPRLQTLAQGWVNKGLNAVGVKFNSKPLDAMPPTDIGSPPPVATTPSPLAPLSVTNTGRPTPPHSSAALPPASPVHSPEAVAPAVPNPPPAAVVNAAPDPVSPPVDSGSHAAVTAPEVQLPLTPAPVPVATHAPDPSPATPDNTDDDPFTRARALRRRAIDAENKGDYTAAVLLFEQIKELPRDSWPGDLELRLKAARANADGQPRH